MKRFALLLPLLAVLGCASQKDVTQAKLRFAFGTNEVAVTQPKDTVIDHLEFNPVTGKISMDGYHSSANAGAVEAAKAQAAGQAAMFDRSIQALEWAFKAGARSQGFAIEDPPSGVTVPKGFKLVPKDDASTLQPEIAVPPPWVQSPSVSDKESNPPLF